MRKKKRTGNPMAEFDNLPVQLRRWLSEAALPWSPASARRVWLNAKAKGLTQDEVLLSLGRAEASTLAREKILHA